MQKALARWYAAAAAQGGPDAPPWRQHAVALLHLGVVLVREARADRLPARAATLSYWTAVAAVPLLLVAFALVGPLGLEESTVAAVRGLLFDTMLAASTEQVGQALTDLIVQIDLGAVGAAGVLGLLVTGSQLYFAVEDAYDEIFGGRARRPLLLRFALFYAGLTLVPLVLSAGVVVSASTRLSGLWSVVPFALSTALWVGGIRLLPSARVGWPAALVGGLLTAALFEGAKAGFGLYTDLLGTDDGLKKVYGSLAAIPVFLLWTNVVWLIVLAGVEVAWVVEHRGALLEAERRSALDPDAERRRPDAFFAMALLDTIADAVAEGRGPADVQSLARDCGTDPRAVAAAVDELRRTGHIAVTDDGRFVAVRPAADNAPAAILRHWHEHTAPRVAGVTAAKVQSWVGHAAEGLTPAGERRCSNESSG